MYQATCIQEAMIDHSKQQLKETATSVYTIIHLLILLSIITQGVKGTYLINLLKAYLLLPFFPGPSHQAQLVKTSGECWLSIAAFNSSTVAGPGTEFI